MTTSLPLALLEAMRPKQWAKNLLLFVGLVFALKLGDSVSLGRALIAFVVFCAISSAAYLFNDLADLEQDRQHPRKRRRPLASGRIRPAHAVALGSTLLLGGLLVAFLLGTRFGLLTFGYVVLNVAYNAGLKHVVLVDVFALASFFVIRAVAGAVAIDVPISPWLYLCTILGALFLGLAKRRHELLLLGDEAASHRQILSEYTPQMLEQLITIVTAGLVMAYSLYTFSAENLPRDHSMMLTIPVVLFGIFRYLYLVHRREGGGSPEETLLTDLPMLMTGLALAGVSVAVLYWRT
ncbi:MAG TPA: decaprenyl-phosphate phosphoribosyltransferase [Chloroflexota bacterium]